MPNQPHALRGSEGSVVDDRLSERKPSTRGPSLGTTENHLGNDSPNTGQDVGAQGNHRDHATGQEISIGDAWSFSYSEDENRGESSFSRVQVQNEQQPLEPRQESIAPSAYDEVPTSNSGNNQAQHDDSFYWHSPHSSASVSHDRDQNLDVPGTSSLLDATPEPQDQYVAAPTPTKEPIDTSEQTAKLYQSTTGPYSASALGFGGPSDWEHFGDYDGEEVDDTDLYIRPRSPVKPKASPDTSELPGDTTPTDVQPELHPPMVEDMIKTTSGIQRIPSGPIPLSEPQTNEVYHHDILKGNSAEKSEHQMQPTASDQQDLMSFSTVERGASIERQLASKSTSMTHLPQFPFEQEQQESTSSEDVVNKVNLNGRSGPMESLIRPGPSIAKNQYEDAPAAEATEMQSGDPAVTNVEWMTERNTAHSDSMVHNDVQQPLDEQFDTQSERENKPRLENGETATGGHEMSRENSTRRGSLVSEGIVLSKVKDFSNPYVDLDPWGKASLNRYVAMLHEEARAPTETEKLNMFRAFIRKEWKLRAILYGADDEQVNDLPLASKDTPVSRTNTLQFRRPASKALPALPPDADQPEVGATKSKSPVSLEMHKPSLAKLITTPKEGPSPRSSGVESHVMIDTPGEQRQQHFEGDTSESYSPGGRPIQFQAKTARRPINPSGPIVNKSNIDASPDNTEEQVSDKKPAYIPFRYSQGYIDDSEQPVDRRASFRPYAALKLEPIKSRPESAPEFVAETSRRSSLPATADSRHVNGSSSSTQAQFHPKRNAANAKSRTSSATDHGPPLDLRRFERADFDPLIAVLPLSGQIPNYAVELPDFQHGIDAVPDDFNFIHQHVVAWDTKAKKIRAENERERQIRQGESDQRIDALFNDDEIGYGDISELESEFKRAEAARKKDEDRAEYQSFVEEVFNAVWTRLHYEIDQLSPLYDRYSSLANETLAGKDMFEATRSQYALAPTLTALLTLHQKLEIRHQKALESVLERDRRLKKTEVAPLYTLGNVAKVKQIEKQFESAERKAIAEYCKQRNARANRLMDVLDQNTLRG